MPYLFDNRYAPITTEMGFVETDHRTAARAFIDWQTPLQAERNVKLTERTIRGGFEDVLRALPPLTSVEHRRFLFIPTRSSWTCYLSNGYRGSDVTGPMLVLSEKVGCRSMRVVAVADRATPPHAKYGANILGIYGPTSLSTRSTIRTIYTVQDGRERWEFHQFGDPFPFEQMERYKAKRARDRFTFDMLEEYLRHLGILAFDASFYLPSSSSPAVLVEKYGPIAGNSQSFSLEEVRKSKL